MAYQDYLYHKNSLTVIMQKNRWSQRLEKAALAVERPVNRLIGNTQLNPFYHMGTIAVFLLAVVGITGVYIFLFFQYGFDDSYLAVATRIEEPIIARIMRAIHRYASGALVVTTLLHAFRTLFMEHFRGPRWLAWLTGIGMTFILWLAGITGYWLVWDSRAQLINAHFIKVLAQFTDWEPAYRLTLIRAELLDSSWQVIMLIFVAHVLLFLITVGFFLYHIRHLNRPRWLPEPVWMLGAISVLFIISALFPSGMLPHFDPNQLPSGVRLDPIFLYYLPLVGTGWDNWLWGFMWLATFGLAALPWLRKRRETAVSPVQIINDKCTGCTKCANDCPYGALTMQERDDDSGHQLIAIADPSKCVECGICVGSCDDFYAIKVSGVEPETMKHLVETQLAQARLEQPQKEIKLIFTCQRHARHGAADYVGKTVAMGAETAVTTISLTCTGGVQPSILPYALAQGAAEVEIVGCPPYDCANRFGNMLEEQRLTNERVPRLRKRYDHVPITAAWLPPDDFELALPLTPVPAPDAETDASEQPDYKSARAMFSLLNWRNLLVGGILLSLILLMQIWLTGLPFTPDPNPPAAIRLSLADPIEHFSRTQKVSLHDISSLLSGDEIVMRLELDEEIVWSKTSTVSEFFAQEQEPVYFETAVSPGQHHIRLYWADSGSDFINILSDQTLDLEPGQILRLHDLGMGSQSK